MSKVIAISIPEELAVELKEFKKKINVSKLCRRAIMERLETLRTAQSGDLIQFLKLSKGDFDIPLACEQLGEESQIDH
jgi:hypothetical protein